MKKTFLTIVFCITLSTVSCKDQYDPHKDQPVYGESYFQIEFTTDKACYKPGETVFFTLEKKTDKSLKIRYSHLGKILLEQPLNSTSWSWIPPVEDYKGYMVDLYEETDNKEQIHHSIAVDVSSDWTKFPRYGFLSSYETLPERSIQNTINQLNRYHINGIQFYDWMYDHHCPLAGTVESPWSTWPDLIGRTNSLTTVKGYIDAAHAKGMKTMFYNLAFGALEHAASDGLKEEWYLFTDKKHQQKDFHPLDAPFRSNIYLTNPGNPQWQSYLAGKHGDVYKVFDFDGYHIDQLGSRGTRYDYYGNLVNLEETYGSFIHAMKQSNPNKRLVMNAVSQYGQSYIAGSETDFLYTEVWDESKTFEQLAQVILDNNIYSNNTKQTVLAAYMNYSRSNQAGFINQAGVLFANAVIFSFGGAHLELGEHYLSNEYFPNSNLQMKSETKQALMHYYDFLVGYQNLLRDGGTFSSIGVHSVDRHLSFQNWPASQGSIAVIGKKFTDKEVIHLINFTGANSMEWRDTNGTQKEPETLTEIPIKITANHPVNTIWVASPDSNGGVSQQLNFEQSGSEVFLTLPSLTYWSMIVLEHSLGK